VNPLVKKILAPLASLKLTVVLLALSMILIYAGTWAQIDNGIWQVQKNYFHTLFTWINFATFFPRPRPGEMRIPGGFPMLGGYALGLLLLANLIAAHALRFKFTPKRIGVIMIHLGLILLLIGEGITSSMAVESQMVIDEGSSANFSQDIRTAELVLIDPSPADHDNIITIPQSRLKKGETISNSAMPVEVQVDDFFHNSSILGPMQTKDKADARATAGAGVGVTLVEQPRISGTDADKTDAPSAYVTLKKNGTVIGTYLASLFIDRPQDFQVDGKMWQIMLRFKRLYKPYTMHLLDFSHENYLGTDIAKDFSSHVRLVDPANHVDREVRIWMNNPLRYNGETFYQSGFRPGDQTTILQVVQNPGWLMPYFACIIGGFGLAVHFSIVLFNFLRKRAKAPVPAIPVRKNRAGDTLPLSRPIWTRGAVIFPVAITFFCVYYVVAHLKPKVSAPYDLNTFGQLPICHEGRVQPLDTLARNSLKVMLGRESFHVDRQRTPAIQWLIDLWTDSDKAASDDVFRIDYPDLLAMLELKPKPKTTFEQITGVSGATPYRFSMNDLKPSFQKLDTELAAVRAVPARDQSLYQRKLAELGKKLQLYISLSQLQTLHLVPPTSTNKDWQTVGEAVQARSMGGEMPKNLEQFAGVLEAYAKKEPQFNDGAKNVSRVAQRAVSECDEGRNVRIVFQSLRSVHELAGALHHRVLAGVSLVGWLVITIAARGLLDRCAEFYRSHVRARLAHLHLRPTASDEPCIVRDLHRVGRRRARERT
jgi:hypothetical protein